MIKTGKEWRNNPIVVYDADIVIKLFILSKWDAAKSAIFFWIALLSQILLPGHGENAC